MDYILKLLKVDGSNLLFNHPLRGWTKSILNRAQFIDQVFKVPLMIEFYKIDE